MAIADIRNAVVRRALTIVTVIGFFPVWIVVGAWQGVREMIVDMIGAAREAWRGAKKPR